MKKKINAEIRSIHSYY